MTSDPALIWLRGLLRRAASRITDGKFHIDVADLCNSQTRSGPMVNGPKV